MIWLAALPDTIHNPSTSEIRIFRDMIGLRVLYPKLAQQQSEPLEQSQFGSVPRIAPLIMAVTQPTPAWTEMAVVGQFFAHAPHSMQAS